MSRKTGGGDWRRQTVNEDQTKVNEDKLGKGKVENKGRGGSWLGGTAGQDRKTEKRFECVRVCTCLRSLEHQNSHPTTKVDILAASHNFNCLFRVRKFGFQVGVKVGFRLVKNV